MEFTHLDKEGRGHMVDVGKKADTLRIATAEGTIRMAEETAAKMKAGPLKKAMYCRWHRLRRLWGQNPGADSFVSSVVSDRG